MKTWYPVIGVFEKWRQAILNSKLVRENVLTKYVMVMHRLMEVWGADAWQLLFTFLGLILSGVSIVLLPTCLILLSQSFFIASAAAKNRALLRLVTCMLALFVGGALRLFSVDYLSLRYLDKSRKLFLELFISKYLPFSSQQDNTYYQHEDFLPIKHLRTVSDWIRQQMSQTVRFGCMFFGSIFNIMLLAPWFISLPFIVLIVLAQVCWSSMKARPASKKIDIHSAFEVWVKNLWRYPLFTMRAAEWEQLQSSSHDEQNRYAQSITKALIYLSRMVVVLLLFLGLLLAVSSCASFASAAMADFIMSVFMAVTSLVMLVEEIPMHAIIFSVLEDINNLMEALKLQPAIRQLKDVHQLKFYHSGHERILDKGLYFLTGSNGAGKTTLLNELRKPPSKASDLDKTRISYLYKQAVGPCSTLETWSPDVVYCKTELDVLHGEGKSKGQIQYIFINAVLSYLKENKHYPLLLLDDVMNCLDVGKQEKVLDDLVALSSHQIIIIAMPELPGFERTGASMRQIATLKGCNEADMKISSYSVSY